MIILLTEEPSMKVTVEALMQKHYPGLVQGWHWFVFEYNGKSDLEKNIHPRMSKWNYGDPFFVILRDADGGNCLEIKNRLAGLAAPSGRPFKVRVVCQELEGWFIGDNQAVKSAFPRCQFSNETEKYRNPDKLTNASDELAGLTGERGKVSRAALIAPHLVPDRNCSRSFQVFMETLQQHLA
jgi:hypothetical protein